MKFFHIQIIIALLALSLFANSNAARNFDSIPDYADHNQLAGIGELKNRYIVVRHGQSKINVPPMFCTTLELDEELVADLTQKGTEQASLAAEKISQERLNADDIVILSSPFRRAIQTARIIAQPLNVDVLLNHGTPSSRSRSS